MLEVKGVSFLYGDKEVLSDVDLSLGTGLISLVGPNGSGKSTLIKRINLILKGKGSIIFDGKDLSSLKPPELARVIGYVPQSTPISFPVTVFDSILLGRRSYMGWNPGKEDISVVSKVIVDLQLEKFTLRNFNELSGGERQKVLIARALAQQPRILLLDEPTSALDIKHQLEVMEVVGRMVAEKKLIALMAIHDLSLASQYSDEIVMMKQGRIYARGTPAETITRSNIRAVYGVDATISWLKGRPLPIPFIGQENTIGSSVHRLQQ